MIRHRIAALAFGLVVAGCAHLAYKRGGDRDDFAAASAHCRKQTAESQAHCLQTMGWQMQGAQTPQAAAVLHGQTAPAPGMIEVASWWKLGGGTADLAKARAACGAGSGRAVLAAAIACMSAKGWHGAGR